MGETRLTSSQPPDSIRRTEPAEPRRVPLRSLRFVPVVGFFVLLVVRLGGSWPETDSTSRVDQSDVAVAFMVTMGALLAVILIMVMAALV